MTGNIYVTRSSMPPYEEYIEAIRPLWESRWLTNMGKCHVELEKQLKAYLGVPELSLMANGHMALELAIQAMEFPEGSEVITTPFTFISTTHAIVRNRLVPVFCDVKPDDGTIDEKKIEALVTEKTVAILPVHVYGNLCNVKAIQDIAYKYQLKVIYDAAHAFGESLEGVGVGTFGDASIFSFHATKVFHTVEGGAVTFADHAMYGKLFNLKNFGIRGEELVVDVGANAKMNEFSAIMGLCNLRHIDEAIESRKKCHDRYRDRLSAVRGIRLCAQMQGVKRNYAYFPIWIENDAGITRNQLYENLQRCRIYTRKYFYPLTSDQACFKNKWRNLSLDTARDLSNRVLTLPIYEELSLEIVDQICDLIEESIDERVRRRL